MILITRLVTTIESIELTTIEACVDLVVKYPFVGGCKIVVEIIGIAKNVLDFGNSGF